MFCFYFIILFSFHCAFTVVHIYVCVCVYVCIVFAMFYCGIRMEPAGLNLLNGE